MIKFEAGEEVVWNPTKNKFYLCVVLEVKGKHLVVTTDGVNKFKVLKVKCSKHA